MSKAKSVGLWILTVLVSLSFIGAGAPKLAGSAQFVETFTRFGYPLWFLYVTGFIEVLGGVLLLVPRTATLGAGLLAGTMVGAVATHLKVGDPVTQVIPPIVLGVLAVIVGLARRNQVMAPFNRFLARSGT
jgi:putative oxidoreductase